MAVNDETFRLVLAGMEVPIASQYTVSSGIFDVPAAWSMNIGMSGQIRKLLEYFPGFTPFELYVDDTRVQLGELDSHELVGTSGTEVKVSGRDDLKWLADVRIDNDRTFSEKTFLDLTKTALGEVNLGDREIKTDNYANRKAITGKSQVTPPPTSEEVQTEAGGTANAERVVYKTLKAEVGTTWWDFLTTQYKRAGLFLWSAADGGFVLSRPDGGQEPIYRIHRRRGARPGDVTVLGHPSYKVDVRTRYSEILVLGRYGGGKDGRGRVIGRAIDDEIVALLNPNEADRADGGKRKKPFVVHDKHVATIEQANFLAKRRLAETRRQSFTLDYKVAGHTTDALSGNKRLIWQPDTVVFVEDEELGINEPMYITNCKYSRTPQTNTVISVIRPSYLVFAEEDFDRVPPVPKPAVRKGTFWRPEWVEDPRVGNLKVLKWRDVDGKLKDAQSDDTLFLTARPGTAVVPQE